MRTLVLFFVKKVLCMSPTWVFSSLPVINNFQILLKAHQESRPVTILYKVDGFDYDLQDSTSIMEHARYTPL